MGIFGSICRAVGGVARAAARAAGSGISAAVSKVVETGKKVVDKAKETFKDIKSKITGMWHKFTGQDKFEEAKALYDKIESRYKKERDEFDRISELNLDRISNHVDFINNSKEKIKRELFVNMATKLSQIKDINISNNFSLEEYIADGLNIDELSSKSSLFKIDFDKHKFKTNVQAIFTLGFYTRKKAYESLYAVQEEEAKVNNEIVKMKAEITRITALEKALSNIVDYFRTLIELYENMLIRLDSSVNFLYVRCMSFVHEIVNAEMSIRRLPLMQQKEIEAIITASKILKEMVDAKILSIEDGKVVNRYCEDMSFKQKQIVEIYNAA